MDILKKANDLINIISSYGIEYGFYGSDENRYIKSDFSDEEYLRLFNTYYILQHPYDLWKTKCGQCWDTTEWFKYQMIKYNVDCGCLYLQLNNKSMDNHTIFYFRYNNKYYYMEYSLVDYRGLNGPFNCLRDMVNPIYTFLNKVSSFPTDKYLLYRYSIPEVSIDKYQFLRYIKKEKKLKI